MTATITKKCAGKRLCDFEIYMELCEDIDSIDVWRCHNVLMRKFNFFLAAGYVELRKIMPDKIVEAEEIDPSYKIPGVESVNLRFKTPGSEMCELFKFRDEQADKYPIVMCLFDLAYRSFDTTGYRFLGTAFYDSLKPEDAEICNKLEQLWRELREYKLVNSVINLPGFITLAEKFTSLQVYRGAIPPVEDDNNDVMLKRIAYAIAAEHFPVDKKLTTFIPPLSVKAFDPVKNNEEIWKYYLTQEPESMPSLALYAWYLSDKCSDKILFTKADFKYICAIHEVYEYYMI
jgi:hypothetical protein